MLPDKDRFEALMCECRFPLLDLDAGRCAYCQRFIPFRKMEDIRKQLERELHPWRVLAFLAATAVVVYLLGLSLKTLLK